MKKNNSSGFTLIELIVVLVIMGLLSGFVMPRMFKTLTNMELKSAARDTISFLARARSSAYYKKHYIKVSFDLGGGLLKMFRYERASTDEQIQISAPEMIWVSIEKYQLPETISIGNCMFGEKVISEGTFDLTFDPVGASNGGQITLMNDEGHAFCIDVDKITGDARIIENENG